MKKVLKDYFSFSRNERNGIGLLLIIILVLLIALQLTQYMVKVKKADFSAFQKEVAEFEASIDSTSNDKNIANPRRNLPMAIDEGFTVDPATATDQEWIKLGLTGHQVITLRHYLSKGGKLSKPEDLKKIYGIKDHQYNVISPHLKFESKTSESANRPLFIKSKSENNKNILVELNSADTFSILAVPGIGKVFANRIIRYRNQLGGFHDKNQLLEVYGFDSVMFGKISPIVLIDTLKLKKINLNLAGFTELKHPYLNSYQIKGILKYRKYRGKISDTKELLKNNLLSPESYRKVKPYLIVD
jgi:competence protein ComEA